MAKYTAEQTAKAVEMYRENHAARGNDVLTEIAEALGAGFTVGSVRAKLVREGVYVAPEKAPAEARPEGPTKAQIMDDLNSHGFPIEGLQGATREALINALEFVKNSK